MATIRNSTLPTSEQTGLIRRAIYGWLARAIAIPKQIERRNSDRLGVLALQKLDDHALRDLGMHRSSIESAAYRTSL